MTIKGIRAAVAGLALVAAGIGGQALAQDYPGHGGYDRGSIDYNRGGYDRGSVDYNRGGDYGRRDFGDSRDQRRDPQQRFGEIRGWTLDLTRSRQIDRRESDRAIGMLGDIRRDIVKARRDGRISPVERQDLNERLDRVVAFVQTSQHDGGRRWDRRG